LPARTRFIPVLLALIIVAAAIGMAACGGGGGSGADARQVVQQTFAGNKPVNSGKLDLSMTANLNATGLAATQLSDPIVIKMTGPFQSRGANKLPAMDLTLAATGSGSDFSAGAVSTGDKGYVTFQGKPYTVPDSVFGRFKRGFEQQQHQDNSTQNIDLKALGINPDSWLKNPKNEGDENVGGATATHVSSDVDVDALLNDLDNLLKRADKLGLSQQQLQQVPHGLNSQTRKQLKDSVKSAKVDLWTGKDDKVLRRLKLDLSFTVPAALQSQLQGVKGGDLKLDLTVADVNKPQDIKPPANPRPWSELQQQIPTSTLGSGLGGSSSGGSSGGSSSGSTGSSGSSGSGSGTSSSKRAQKYLKCVQQAQRPEDVTKCGSILGR
jgi:hypothetical protein